MSVQPTIAFAPLQMPETGTLVILAGAEGALPSGVPDALADALQKAITVAKFKGKELSTVDAVAPSGSSLDRIVVVGTAGEKAFGEEEWLRLGGVIAGSAKGEGPVTVWGDGAATPAAPKDLAAIGLGILLRSYKFDRYKSKKTAPGEEAENETARSYTIASATPDEARAAFAVSQEVAEGVILARDLVNEPANVLTTTEYAARIEALASSGLEIETLDEARMAELGMRALLGVAQGSPMPPRSASCAGTAARRARRPSPSSARA